MKQNPELESVELLAKIILTAARTAPKGKGIDDIITCLLSQEEKAELADKMEELSEIKGYQIPSSGCQKCQGRRCHYPYRAEGFRREQS